MLIEQKTSYAYKLKYLENPTFDKVRGFAKSFIDDLPKELVDELYSQLDRGVVQIDSEPQMLVYLYSFGNMHQAKLNKAFENIPEILFDQPEINIIDYGCGQAIGTMCYVDFIRQKGVSQKVKRVTLIEPSEICLKRAALHVSAFCPDAEIVTINKEFDDLDDEDIVCEEDIPTLHILSNVLDLDFDLERFAELISDNLKGYNQFVCVGPYFGFSDKDKRMRELCTLLNGEENYSKFFDKFELNAEREWTAQIRCFSNGELEEMLSTEATKEDFRNSIKERSSYGWLVVSYSRDKKKLLRGYNGYDRNKDLEYYRVENGTKVICDNAFSNCKILKIITLPNSVTSIGNGAFYYCESLQQITIPNSVKRIYNYAFGECKSLRQIVIPNSVKIMSVDWKAFYFCESLQQITLPNSVTSIGDEAFSCCFSLQQINIPDSVTSIGGSAFKNCKSLQQIAIPNSVRSIGKEAFGWCESLQQITIPNSVESIEESVFVNCKSLQHISIPNSVTSIGNDAFNGCESLQQITIPDSVTSIGIRSFNYCASIQQITIPNSVTSIGDLAFHFCKSLQQITISNSVTSIVKNAFEKCESLQQIIIPEGSEAKFLQMLPEELWDKLYSMKKVVVVKTQGEDDLPF